MIRRLTNKKYLPNSHIYSYTMSNKIKYQFVQSTIMIEQNKK